MQPLQFRQNKSFTIVQFTDIHWQEGQEKDLQSRAAMEQVLDDEQPDLVMLTGDTIFACQREDGTDFCNDPKRALREALAPIIQRKIPWALVFGNHDSEHGITREELMEEIKQLPFNLTEAGPDSIHGTGNYVLPVASSTGEEAALLLYGLDSGDYADKEIGGYDWIRQTQINWYIEQSNKWKARHNGHSLPALAFFHIPLPEYDLMWKQNVCYGQKHEAVCASNIQSGFFAAMLEQGDIIAAFCGHDHINDFYGTYFGIQLYYGRATGYNTYGHETMQRGARVIQLTEGSKTVKSWLRLADGSVITQQQQHMPETS